MAGVMKTEMHMVPIGMANSEWLVRTVLSALREGQIVDAVNQFGEQFDFRDYGIGEHDAQGGQHVALPRVGRVQETLVAAAASGSVGSCRQTRVRRKSVLRNGRSRTVELTETGRRQIESAPQTCDQQGRNHGRIEIQRRRQPHGSTTNNDMKTCLSLFGCFVLVAGPCRSR